MRKTAVFLAVVSLAFSSLAAGPMLMQGTRDLGVSGLIDFNSPDGHLYAVDGNYGYFFADYFDFGGKLAFQRTENANSYMLGPYAEYNFDVLIYEQIIPFLGGSILFGRGENKLSDSSAKNALVFGLNGGVKFFLADNVALTPQLSGQLATSEIFAAKEDVKNYDVRLELGLRFFF